MYLRPLKAPFKLYQIKGMMLYFTFFRKKPQRIFFYKNFSEEFPFLFRRRRQVPDRSGESRK